MATERKFAGFGSKGSPPFRMSEIPPGGFCISSFILLTNSEGKVLMGKLNPDYGWDHIGALDEWRKQRHSTGWMLPSCHLIMGESPRQAAERIVEEQLGLTGKDLSGPEVYSETYTAGPERQGEHWDLEFVFRGKHDAQVSHPAWKVLAYVDPDAPEETFTRNHQDILRSSGLRKRR